MEILNVSNVYTAESLNNQNNHSFVQKMEFMEDNLIYNVFNDQKRGYSYVLGEYVVAGPMSNTHS